MSFRLARTDWLVRIVWSIKVCGKQQGRPKQRWFDALGWFRLHFDQVYNREKWRIQSRRAFPAFEGDKALRRTLGRSRKMQFMKLRIPYISIWLRMYLKTLVETLRKKNFTELIHELTLLMPLRALFPWDRIWKFSLEWKAPGDSLYIVAWHFFLFLSELLTDTTPLYKSSKWCTFVVNLHPKWIFLWRKNSGCFWIWEWLSVLFQPNLRFI